MKIIIFSSSFEALDLLSRFKGEGREVALAAMDGPTDPVGGVEMMSATEAVKKLKRVPEGERKGWFILCMEPMHELDGMGFPGMFPAEDADGEDFWDEVMEGLIHKEDTGLRETVDMIDEDEDDGPWMPQGTRE
jgi:hypothetical protein